MSVPHSSILSSNRGFLAKVDTNINSPQQSQNINVVVNPYERTLSNGNFSVHYPEVKNIDEDNNNNNNNTKERSINTANNTYDNLQKIIHDKDLLIQALVLCLDIVENNPLIVNKYIVAEEGELIKLIQLLCDTSEIQLIKADNDIGCISHSKYNYITKIYIIKDGNTYNLKYSFPDVVEFLDNRKISLKFVKI